ncbi:MAG: UvrD-helicase domain-containing protein [Rhodobacteraceae bacterium]|nr:UvrD-helicase domain-containing protein [Paracoccaceae bacterium]
MTTAALEIRRGRIAGLFLRLLGQGTYGARLGDTELEVFGGTTGSISLLQVATPAKVARFLWSHSLELSLNSGAVVRVAGLKRGDAASFAANVNTAWRREFATKIDEYGSELAVLSEVIKRLERPRRYPSACLLEPFVKRANMLIGNLPASFPEGSIDSEKHRVLELVSRFQKTPGQVRDIAINTFVNSELTEMQEFFDGIETNPLTPEQRLSVVTDEDATLVLAGAGSGKTSVIVAKAAYLIERDVRQPEEILLMAFGAKAAEEMATRIEERSGASVDALTFHALGYAIIREVEGGAPALAAHASDDAQFRVLLRDILFNDIAKQPALRLLLLKWFSGFFWPYKSEWDFKTKDEYFQYVEAHELRTFQGELVKSFEEWEIANWLYLNSIAYEYEPDYEHALPENIRTAYTPDFKLTESGVYIEHFGVRKSRGINGSTVFTTAPYVDRKEYLEGMEWKRKVHNDHETTLVETFSYERVEGRLTGALEEKLAPYATPKPVPADQIFDTLADRGQVDSFTMVLCTFLRHFKSSGTTLEQCEERASSSEDKFRSLAFMKIFEPLLKAYQTRLGERIDFEDMIVRATEHVRTGRYKSPYRHFLVDEFQDISDGRAQLLLALKAQHNDARIFAVGDDWQSIYRFAGADIHLMRNFGNLFGGTFTGKTGVHQTVDLGRTFRSVDKIALPARSFILQNPSQIQKRVVTVSTTDTPAIRVTYFSGGKERASLASILEDFEVDVASGKSSSVLLLGRYHFLRPDKFTQLKSCYPRLSIRFMTVHAAKGLEADHVVILGATTSKFGFPSEIVDDPLLDLVLPEPEDFDHAEERRLFYVAMTRARKTVTVSASREKPSVFARELVENEEYEVIELGSSGVAEQRCGACGGRMLERKSKKGATFFACEHRALCGETHRACNVCNSDLPRPDKADPGKLGCRCGAEFAVCPDCSDGWLVERKGRYGPFLSCVKYPSCKGKKSLNRPETKKGNVSKSTRQKRKPRNCP